METVVKILGCMPLLKVGSDICSDVFAVSVNMGSERVTKRVKCEKRWGAVEHSFCEARDTACLAQVGVGCSCLAEDVEKFGSASVMQEFAEAFDLKWKCGAERGEWGGLPVLRPLARDREKVFILDVRAGKLTYFGAPEGEHGGDTSCSVLRFEPKSAVTISMEVASEFLENVKVDEKSRKGGGPSILVLLGSARCCLGTNERERGNKVLGS
jgi:hypothetical protein